jgi:hypothetical protein
MLAVPHLDSADARITSILIHAPCSATFIADHDLGSEADLPEIRKQKPVVVEFGPMHISDLPFRIEQLLVGSGDIFPCPSFKDEIDAENLILFQLSAELYVREIGYRLLKGSSIDTSFSWVIPRISGEL